MADPHERFYFGDWALWGAGVDHYEDGGRTVTQEFAGVDHTHATVLPASSNMDFTLEVQTLGEPNPNARTRKGWRSTMSKIRTDLNLRSLRADPVVWIEDTTKSKVVQSYVDPVISSPAHGFVNDDRVLIRRLGAGLFTLGKVLNAAADSFEVSDELAVPGHAIAANDDILLVESYWAALVCTRPPMAQPNEDGDYYAMGLTWRFRGNGRFVYHRTAPGDVGN